MSPRRIITLSGRAVRLTGYVAVGGLLLFFALTRTEVGREGLRVQLERQFSDRFDGRLEIGTLKGNLLHRLSAGQVRILDSADRVVFSADSIVAHPSWRDLLDRTLSIGRITLIRPEIHLVRETDDRWNAAAIFARPGRSASAENWSFSSAHVTVIQGHVTTRSMGSVPPFIRDELLFDYLNAELEDLNGRAIVDWQPGLKFVDILQLSGRLPDIAVSLDSLRGQFLLRNKGMNLNAVHARLGSTRLHLAGSISSHTNPNGGPAEPLVELDLRPSTLHAEELTRVFPRLPIADQLTASMRVQGPLSGLVLEDFLVAHGASHLSAEGTLVGLPDSLDYELALRPGLLQWRDLDAVYAGPVLPAFDHLGVIEYSGLSDGVVRIGQDDADRDMEVPAWQAATELQTHSRAGTLQVDFLHALGGAQYLSLDGFLLADNLNVGLITQDVNLASDLNGRATFRVTGSDLAEATGNLTAALSTSWFAGRSVDSLNVELASEEGDVSGRLTVERGGGRVDARLRAALGDERTAFALDGSLSRFDLGHLMLSDSLSSSLNLDFEIEGSAGALHTFEGQARFSFDSSRVAFGREIRPVAPHLTTLSVRQLGSSAPHIEVGGDVLSLRITGDVAVDPFLALARHWTGALAHSTANALAKPLHPDTSRSGEERFAAGTELDASLYARSGARLERAGLSRQSLAADLHILRADILGALIPTLPIVQTNLVGRLNLTFNADWFHFDGSVSADSFTSGDIRSGNFEAIFQAEGDLQDVRAQSISAQLRVDSERLFWKDQPFVNAEMDAAFRDSGLDLLVQSFAPGAVEPLRLDARLDLLDLRNRVHLNELQLSARDQVWRTEGAHTIDLYRDAVVVREVSIHRTDDGSSGGERIQIRGTLSETASDTLLIAVRDVQLRDVATLFALDRPIDGTINGRLAYTGFTKRPELTGAIHIEPLAYAEHVLGSVHMDSRYIPGSPDVALEIHVAPLPPAESAGRRYEENELTIAGTFRLPRLAAASVSDEGALNLRLDVEKLDAFFLEYIFGGEIDAVRGFFAGDGRIDGPFSRPIFHADLDLRSAGFEIPDFNLAYAAEGAVRVDEEGIHLDELLVTDATDGSALVSGSILFNEYRYFSFNLRGELDEFRIMNVDRSRELPFYGRIWATGQATLSGPLANAFLRADNAIATSRSNLYIPVSETVETTDSGFIVFADTAGNLPDIRRLTRRSNVLARRPEGERPFLEGLEMNLNITAPEGSTVHLVIDPLLGDEINAVGQGRIELIRTDGEFFTFGTFDVDSGDYLFTAGDVFYRRFLIDDGSIRWDGDPLNPMLDIEASYRTRASTEGLAADGESRLIPLVIRMNVLGRVTTPSVGLALAVDRNDRSILGGYEGLESELNQPELAAQYATSVLLTNSFLLTTTSLGSQQAQGLSDTRNQLAFNSLSQLVASQLNRYLSYALPNLDLNLGVQGESAQDLDVTYGVALRLLDERLIIRGRGIYRNESTENPQQQSGLDEFVVEVRLNPNVSVEVFYRREGDLLSASESFNTSTGAGVSYQTQFASWNRFVKRVFGWLLPTQEPEAADEPNEEEDDAEDIVAGGPD